MSLDAESLLQTVGDHIHLKRERSLATFQQAIESNYFQSHPKCLQIVQMGVLSLVASDQWEKRLGGLKVAALLVTAGVGDEPFTDAMIQTCKNLLEDPEVRVRWAVGELLRALCEQHGTIVWEAVKKRILDSIRENFNRDAAEPSSSHTHQPPSTTPPSAISALLQHSYRSEPPGHGEMRHGTEGWKCLETSFRALQHVMEGCGSAFSPQLDEPLRALIYKALLHPNRFVREACHFIMGSVCRLLESSELEALGPEIASKLGLGMSDNWSQVRYAASVATRSFLLAVEPFRESVLPLVLPHMCLNRYYVAEGVRLYSQETWELVMGGQGRVWVARCAPQIVSYYVEQSKANNHAVREAACACIAELMSKVDREAVSPHVPRLLRALLTCFRDASWPVRDAACLACGRCVLAFPKESREILDKLYELWFSHLSDNIFSVREDSAVALGDAARAYGDEAIEKIVGEIQKLLPMAQEQPADSKAAMGLQNTTLFGVAADRVQRANDAELHTDRLMFSCGSLAPRLARGGDGCMDHGFARAREPWEATDGAIYMIRELADVAPERVPQFLQPLADVARLRHFSHCLNLQETLWKSLPIIARRMGKNAFKAYLELFLDPLFHLGLTCGHRLCEVAAGQCIGQLRDLIGPGIFAGRLNEDQRRILNSSHDIPQSTRSGVGSNSIRSSGNGAALRAVQAGVST